MKLRIFCKVSTLLCAFAGAASTQAWAQVLSPDQIFEKVSPSVWAVRGLDSNERPFSYGSGVVVAPGRLITNCHVLARAKAIQVRRENVSYEAKLEHADVERDLCQLSVAGFSAPAVAIASMEHLKVGQRAYAVGNPQKFALTLSEGLISGLRGEDPRVPPIQTTAPISPGSSGGGLFDAQGRLVGITTLIFVGRERLAQSINFAIPADWIGAVPERAAAALVKRDAKKGVQTAVVTGARPPASGTLPVVGALWTYRYSDLLYGRVKRQFTLRVAGIDGWDVRETFEDADDVAGGRQVQPAIGAGDLSFFEKRIGADRSIVEFAPYLIDTDKLDSGLPWRELSAAFPLVRNNALIAWEVSGTLMGKERVEVPAGVFQAIRVEMRGENSDSGGRYSGRRASSTNVAKFIYSLWYAPEAKRYVKIHQQTWDGKGATISDESVELLKYGEGDGR